MPTGTYTTDVVYPSFTHEQTFWQQGIQTIAGIDEVGMGALAGPVVAAAVIVPQHTSLDGVRDSKTLTPKRREQLAGIIKESATAWAIGEASVEEISRLNIRAASHLAMARAVAQLLPVPQLLLIDGTPAQIHPTIPAVNIIDGDALSYSIAAASIIAKVYRDDRMAQLHTVFPQYGFASHKGYGSASHKEALAQYGPCPHHRPTYTPIAQLLKR